MKKIALLTLSIAGLVAMTGCSTPGYSAKERGQQYSRAFGLEWQMMNDDIDQALMVRPMSTLSRWNIR